MIRIELGRNSNQVLTYEEVPASLAQELSDALEDSSWDCSADSEEGILRLDWDLVLLSNEFRCSEADLREKMIRCAPSGMNDDILEAVGELLEYTDLPENCPLDLVVSRRGLPGTDEFLVSGTWTRRNGLAVATEGKVRGALLEFENGEQYLLNLAQYRAWNAIEELDEFGQNRDSDRLAPEKVRASVASLPSSTGVVFDEFLVRNETQQVERFQPRLEESSNGYNIVPSTHLLSEKEVKDLYYRTPKSDYARRPIKSRTNDGRRVTTLVSPEAAKGLVDLRAKRGLSGRDVAKVLSNPEEHLGENLDLSEFSERISGFGVEVKRPVPSFGEAKVDDWWTWDVNVALDELEPTDNPSAEFGHLSLKDRETRIALRRAIDDADADGSTLIPCPSGRGFIELSQQLRAAVQAAEKLAETSDAQGRLNRSPRKILQVLQNLEELCFDRSQMPEIVEPSEEFEPPAGLLPPYQLHSHQVEGYRWLMTLYRAESQAGGSYRGALLADDMGVGKTLQVLSMLANVYKELPERPHLVVAPLSLLLNWENEARRFFGDLFDPIFEVRGSQMRGEHAGIVARLSKQKLVLTSYETLRRKELVFAAIDWNVVVLDEAQKGKNPASQISRVLRTLKARFRLAATGTPVENSLSELWSVMDWAVPGLLSSLRDFGNKYIRPLKTADDSLRRALAEELQSVIGPVFIRRMKEDLEESLPEIYFHRDSVGLNEEQRERYANVMAAQESPALVKLQQLFQVCQHPSFGSSESELPSAQSAPFPRISSTFERLDRVRELNEKAIVFCNRVVLQKWLKREIENRYGVSVSVVNGAVTDSRRRLKIIDRFSNEPGFSVVVLATKAAGVGLNITAANHVLHYTREWNPALENQATDRAYRIGQERAVHVHYFVSTDERGKTVDEHLDELLEKKRLLMRDFVIPMGGFEVSKEEAEVLVRAGSGSSEMHRRKVGS